MAKKNTAQSNIGKKFDGDFKKLPSPRMLQALMIRSIEKGETFKLPTDRNEAFAMLGYEPRGG